jgi:putative sterol carrier protein
MLPIDIPLGTTAESLVTEVVPALHARLVGKEVPRDPLPVTVRIEGVGAWTITIQGNVMTVEDGESPQPALWMWTTARAVDWFLEDARGPKRLMPRVVPPAGGALLVSDPRIVKRVAMASGRVELALRTGAGKKEEEDERLVVVLGLGAAAKRAIDPEDADTCIEAELPALERVLRGELGPEEALGDGDVAVRGNRFLAMQLALSLAPLYPGKPAAR